MRIRTVIFLPTKSRCIVPQSHHTCKSRVVREVALNRSLGITWPLSSFWLIHRLCVGGLHYLPVAENAPKRPALIPRNQNVINLLTLFKANKKAKRVPLTQLLFQKQQRGIPAEHTSTEAMGMKREIQFFTRNLTLIINERHFCFESVEANPKINLPSLNKI